MIVRSLPFSVSVPWPGNKLSPNARVHHMTLYRAKRAYKAACIAEMWAQGLRAIDHDGTKIRIDMTFVPRVRRDRDNDNLIARMKAGLDALASVIGVDDRLFIIVPPGVADPNTTRPRVIITCSRAI